MGYEKVRAALCVIVVLFLSRQKKSEGLDIVSVILVPFEVVVLIILQENVLILSKTHLPPALYSILSGTKCNVMN